jgi:hypothetical protein
MEVYMSKKFLKFFIILIIIFFIFSQIFSVFAFTPKIVNKLNSSFNDIEKWCIKLATPAAAVSFAIGLFIKKFSFGDEERIRISKKITRATLVSYALLLAIDLILATIKSLIS